MHAVKRGASPARNIYLNNSRRRGRRRWEGREYIQLNAKDGDKQKTVPSQNQTWWILYCIEWQQQRKDDLRGLMFIVVVWTSSTRGTRAWVMIRSCVHVGELNDYSTWFTDWEIKPTEGHDMLYAFGALHAMLFIHVFIISGATTNPSVRFFLPV